MEIHLGETKRFEMKALERLFESVGWASARYPEKLVLAMQGSETVISAWDGDVLVGLMTAMSDKVMTVYFHWLLVDPAYQKQGVGRQILERMLGHYEGYVSCILNSYNEQIGFYQRCGFVVKDALTPMKYQPMDKRGDEAQ